MATDYDNLLAVGLAQANQLCGVQVTFHKGVYADNPSTGLVTDTGTQNATIACTIFDTEFLEEDLVKVAIGLVLNPNDLPGPYGTIAVDDTVTVGGYDYNVKQLRTQGLPNLLTVIAVAT